jgi:diguanylate cyclase (GGDEF)-like protein/PAS domain S-box-containing protein
MFLLMLLLAIYLVPVAILFYMALEIYYRNSSQILNKLTAYLLFTMSTLFLGSFISNAFPPEYYVTLNYYFIYIPSFMIMPLVIHFSLKLSSSFDNWSSLRIALLCYSPALSILLILFPPSWIELIVTINGPWKDAKPNFALMLIIILLALYTMTVSGYLLTKGLRVASNHPNIQMRKKQIQIILVAISLAGCWAILCVIFDVTFVNNQLKTPDSSAFSVIIFAYFLRYAMTKYSFLPPTERKYQVLYELSPLAIVLLNQEAKIDDANPAALKLFDVNLKEIRERSFPSFLSSTDRKSFLKLFNSGFAGRKFSSQEYSIIKSTLEERLVQAESELIAIEGQPYQYVILRDITESRLAEQRIAFLAYHDPLTGLANRSMFQQKLAEALTESDITQQQIAVLLMDLDRFKLVNDTKGHHVGDLLLQYVAKQLKEHTPDKMCIARLGGDEFAMFLTGVETEEETNHLARCILEALKEPFIFEGTPFYITGSLGICLSPQYGESGETLLKNADIAMYYAKNNGRDRYQIYNHHLKHPDLDRLTIDVRLRKALELQEFEVYYQPQVDLENGEVIGVEALVRWISPERGIVYPGEFIPLAEESGLIVPLGHWILEQACKDMKKWCDAGLPLKTVSVNISPDQLKESGFLERLSQILAETQIDPKRLCLEITETSSLLDEEYMLDICREIKDLNIGLIMDDFGTGYSSFSLLKYMQFNAIKIDRSFVTGIMDNENEAAIINAIIVMAHGLQQKVIAEGVEDTQQWERLKALGCDQIQGFYYSEALQEKDLFEYMRNIKQQPRSV